MSSYTKLFSHIITSSIWSEDDQTRILWITMLALSDKYGEVQASIPGLAKVSNLSLESVKRGIAILCSPDEYSRTPDEEGRRIIPMSGGWSIVNYEKHRRMASIDEQRTKAAERQRRHRERVKRNAHVTQCMGDVTQSNNGVTHETDNAEAEAEAEASTEVPKVIREGPNLAKGSNGHRNTKDWLKELRGIYTWVNFDQEVNKAKAHLLLPKCKGRKFTQTFFTAWLNRIDRPLESGGSKSGTWRDSKTESADEWSSREAFENYQKQNHEG